MASIIVALFDTPENAAAAVQTLESRGIDPDRISLLAGETFKKDSFAVSSHSKLPEGVAIGASTGGAIGALVAGLTTVGTIATGGAALIAAGPIVAALAGAGAGAAGGGVLGGLIGLGVPEHEVKHYEDALNRGSVLVGVECASSDEKDLARDTFRSLDAEKISHA